MQAVIIKHFVVLIHEFILKFLKEIMSRRCQTISFVIKFSVKSTIVSMSYNTYFGWELLTKLIENDLKNPGDTIVALVHWQLVQLGFSCLGSGDDVKW